MNACLYSFWLIADQNKGDVLKRFEYKTLSVLLTTDKQATSQF